MRFSLQVVCKSGLLHNSCDDGDKRFKEKDRKASIEYFPSENTKVFYQSSLVSSHLKSLLNFEPPALDLPIVSLWTNPYTIYSEINVLEDGQSDDEKLWRVYGNVWHIRWKILIRPRIQTFNARQLFRPIGTHQWYPPHAFGVQIRVQAPQLAATDPDRQYVDQQAWDS